MYFLILYDSAAYDGECTMLKVRCSRDSDGGYAIAGSFRKKRDLQTTCGLSTSRPKTRRLHAANGTTLTMANSDVLQIEEKLICHKCTTMGFADVCLEL